MTNVQTLWIDHFRESILSLLLGLMLFSPREVKAGLRFDAEPVDYAGWMDPRFSEESLRNYGLSQIDYEKLVKIKRFIENRVENQINSFGTFDMSKDPYVQYYSKQMDQVLRNYQRGYFSLEASQKVAMSWLRGFFRLLSKPKRADKPTVVTLGIRG